MAWAPATGNSEVLGNKCKLPGEILHVRHPSKDELLASLASFYQSTTNLPISRYITASRVIKWIEREREKGEGEREGFDTKDLVSREV